MKTVYSLAAQVLIVGVITIGIFSFTTAKISGKTVHPSYDSVVKKGISLTGAQEVPAVTTSGSGSLDVSYDKNSKTLRYNASWSGLSDSVTMMHFHGPATKGANAGVVVPIPDFTKGTAGTANGSVTVDEVKAKEADLLGGKWYYNIHTKTHPAGEIRGQVEF